MQNVYLFWNNRIHPDELSLQQINVALQRPHLSYLHNCLVDSPNDIAIGPAIRNGTYEYFELCHIKKHLSNGDTFIDVGSCVGLYSIVASKCVGDSGKVISIEPYSTDYINTNVTINDRHNIQVINKAAGNTNHTAFLNIDQDNYGNHTVDEIGSGRQVDVITLDDIPNISDVRCIKIDTQGDDFNVLIGSKSIIDSSPRLCVLVELAPKHLAEKGSTCEDYVDFLVGYMSMDIQVFIPNYMETHQNGGMSINFAAGYSMVPLSRQQILDYCKWESDKNPDWFINLWCSKS